MPIKRRLFAAGATLVVAALIGHFVDAGGDLFHKRASTRTGVTTPVPNFPEGRIIPLAAPAQTADANGVQIPFAPKQVRATTGFETESKALAARLAMLDRDRHGPLRSGENLNEFGLPCATDLSAKPAAGGMVALTLTASCAPLARVEVMQDRLSFALRNSATGDLNILVPALSADPVFIVQIEDGPLLTATAHQPQARDFDRVALQWQGAAMMHLHAFEFGADYNDTGHIWAGHPRDASVGDAAVGGFMTVLGDSTLPNPSLAEVYSYPRGESRDSGVVRINIEAEVLDSNCGQEIVAETLQPGADGALAAAQLSLTMPDCGAVGEFLVLKNILRDLKIAHN
ncbi:hypothetical protein [Actibacterium sp.]|uniref:hypothetical protein n=1 Tax=Actibacterium sp. TaxID=1872125 RepID=UPI003563CFD9